MGDATNLVLILAGELLKRSEHLLTMGLHPSDVILGYEMALEKGRQELECEEVITIPMITCWQISAMVVSTLSPTPLPTVSELAAAIAPSIASKQPGSEKLLSTLAAEAALAVMPKNPKDFNVDTVRVVKVLGGGLSASRVVKGMVFGREAEGKLSHLL
jgi:T-complex protein 1 subunit theta